MNKILLHQQSAAKILPAPRLPNCTLCHDWSVGNGASMTRVNSNCRTYSTLYTVWYNTLHRFLDGRIPQVRIPHILRGEVPPGIYLGRWNRFIHGHPSSSGHIGDTDYIQIQVTQSKHIITRQKYGIVKAEYYVGWHRGVYTLLHTHLSQAFIKPPVTVSSTMVC